MPFTPRSDAPADALVAVGPVFASTRPSTRLSRVSVVGHPGSENGGGFRLAAAGTTPLDVHPAPDFQIDATRCVPAGSNSNGTTVKSNAYAVSIDTTMITAGTNRTAFFIRPPPRRNECVSIRRSNLQYTCRADASFRAQVFAIDAPCLSA